MKKIVVLSFALMMAITSAQAVDAAANVEKKVQEQVQCPMKNQREISFERRLNLTEVQKLKAREIRKNGHEKLKPVIDQIKSKKQEAEMVRRSRIAVQMQEEKLAIIDKELKVLEKQANSIRKSNMKEFESILTWQQKRILKDMKKEGRKRYHQSHPCHKPVMFNHMPNQNK